MLERGDYQEWSSSSSCFWSVMEDFSKAPGGKDLSKMKAQYEMFVDAVGSKEVTV